jgi:hypothetical protein
MKKTLLLIVFAVLGIISLQAQESKEFALINNWYTQIVEPIIRQYGDFKEAELLSERTIGTLSSRSGNHYINNDEGDNFARFYTSSKTRYIKVEFYISNRDGYFTYISDFIDIKEYGNKGIVYVLDIVQNQKTTKINDYR